MDTTEFELNTMKDFTVVNEADAFLEFSCFLYYPVDVGNLISGSLCLLKNLYAGQEATIRTGHETTDWF